MREMIPLCQFLHEIVDQMGLTGSTNVIMNSKFFKDNNGGLATDRSMKMTPQTKHIAIKYYLLKDSCGSWYRNQFFKIDTNLQKVGILTKGISCDKFTTMKNLFVDGNRLVE